MSYRLRILSKQESGKDLIHLTCAADGAVLESFHTPGQFLVVSVPGDGSGEAKKGFFAIASRPGAEHIELLIKRQGAPATALCDAPVDSEFECSEAQGGGFAAPTGRIDHIHLFAMGSGLAPLRSYILTSLAAEESASAPKKNRGATPPPMSKLTLWQGSFAKANLPFRDEYEAWEAAGLEIILCLDQDSEEIPGNVSERLRELSPDLRGSAAYWIGSKEFGQALKEATARCGLPPEALFTNF
ncbi:MAG: FAD-dependent oxidoreductase [Leptospirales bacterium]|jgi:ferredoxin-NADP reductase